ncbi:PIN domain-containing protein [Oscillibacter ruminantium]|uniref:PIN domain-containing protein n=1 Tax=Oscillibacter ruminantium TaxID=1263547 RepID=UPI0033202E36
MNMIFLVDGDNNIGTGLQGADQLTADDSILVFYQKTGLALNKIKELCKGSKASVQYLESVKGGKNSIDFQIITELGVLVGRGEADCAYVISQDKGYEAAMSALRARYTGAFREVALRPSIAACLKASYLMRATSAEELCASLKQEFGEAQGAAAFAHLRELFTSVSSKTAEKPAEIAAEKPVKKSRGGRRRPSKSAEENASKAKPADVKLEKAEKPVAVQPAPKPQPAPATVQPAPKLPAAAAEEKPAVKIARTHRGGRRKKKPAGEKTTEES